MIELIKKTLLTGVGLAVMTTDKVREMGEDLVSQAKLSENEGREFVDNLMKQSETARAEFETRVGAAVKKAVESMNLVHKDELAKLHARIDALAAEVARNQQPPAPG